MAAFLAPHDQPNTGRASSAERHRRDGFRFHLARRRERARLLGRGPPGARVVIADANRTSVPRPLLRATRSVARFRDAGVRVEYLPGLRYIVQ
jgi:hypothetical protein